MSKHATSWRIRFVAGLALLLASSIPASAKPIVVGKPVDLVLCLDVSNSMDGLIDSAKIKLWDIVNDFSKIKPTPELRVALYSYGSPRYSAGAGFIRCELDLTNDLDEVYKRLNALRTYGGEEYVAGVAKAALDELKWSANPKALRLLFVCGNERADQDPRFKIADVARQARRMDILINTIHCASAESGDDPLWKELARLAGGKGVNIDQNRNVLDKPIPTPHDDDLRKLSGELNKTYLAYGNDRLEAAKKQMDQDKAAEAAAPAAGAARSASKASALYRNDAWDLVDRLKNDSKFQLKDLPEDQLPEELRKLSPEKREAAIQAKCKEREALQARIQELAAKREAFLRDARAKEPKKSAEKAFDEALRELIREQAATRELVIPQ